MNGSSLGGSTKAHLRQAVRQRRAARDPQVADATDQQRTGLVLDQLGDLVGASAAVVAAYWSTLGEPGTHLLVETLRAGGHRVLLPVVSTGPQRPAWGWFTAAEDLTAAPLGLREPPNRAPSDAILGADVVICPGLLGGRDGSRLGTGGGWYDRALVQVSAHVPRWLLLFSDEVVDAVPTQPHDLNVTDLVSEAGWVRCRPRIGDDTSR